MSEMKKCGHVVGTTGEECEYPGKYSDGRCGYHTEERAEERKDQGRPPKGHARAMTHGLSMTRSKYYQLLPDEEKEYIDDMMQGFLHEAPFDESSIGKCKLLEQVCIDIHMKTRAQDYVAEKGMTQKKTKGVVGESVIKDDEENTLFITSDRLSRTSLKTLKELGILDPTKHEMRKNKTLVDILSGLSGDKE